MSNEQRVIEIQRGITLTVNFIMLPVMLMMWLSGLIVGNFIRPFVEGFYS